MKKKLLIGFATLALGLVAAFNINLNTQKSELSAFSLANVEALANDESGSERKQTLVLTSYSCTIVIEAGGGYIHQSGRYWGCVDDPFGSSSCRAACVAVN